MRDTGASLRASNHLPMILTLLAGTALSIQAATGAAVRIPNLAPAPTGSQVLAKVGTVQIKAEDIAGVLWEARGEEILNDFVAYHMLKAQAEKQGVVVSDADVMTRMTKLLKEQEANLPPGTDPQAALNDQGLTAGRLFLNVKTDLLLDGLVNLAFRPANYVKVSTIIVVPKSKEEADVKDANDRIARAAARIKAGETWEKVAAETIEDPNAKNTGGFLGWRPLDLFPAAVRAEISALSAGGVSGVAATNFGIQIFRVEGQGKDAKGGTIEEIKTAAGASLREKILQDIRTNAKVERVPIVKPKAS